ncbi:MAG: hypothetical protein M1828_001621 [Chrysothrix sp. TS-e1954]|nr:MAG: hypothetical protein M1828_001621 [Chrysothrix sp. TS-e1954]
MEAVRDSSGLPGFHSTVVDVYVTFIIIYTFSLLAGLALLWKHRGSSAVRIRGYPTIAITVLCLHVYVAAIFIVYPIGSGYECNTEFWYMNVLFPFGLAVFQGASARLFAVSKLQQDVFVSNRWSEKKLPFAWNIQGLKAWYKQRNFAQRTYLWIYVMMGVQVIVTFFVFFGSRRFHPTTGVFGQHVGPIACRRGFEWLPSVLWQFVWTWILGPYYLFRSRRIRDTHHWALQTRLVVIAGLPGTPLWLAFLYTEGNPHLDNLNYYWPPASWYVPVDLNQAIIPFVKYLQGQRFAPGLIVMQVSSILIPLLDARRHPSPQRAKSIASSISSASSTFSERPLASGSSGRRSKELAGSFNAFQHQIVHNAAPLARFAAEREFTTENIEFLCRIRAFKSKWDPPATTMSSTQGAIGQKDMREMYTDAARIFFELVDSTMSRTPINVESKTYSALEALFRAVKYEPPASSQDSISENVVTPWEMPPTAPPRGPHSCHSNESAFDLFQDDDITTVGGSHDGRITSRFLSGPTEHFYNPIAVPADFDARSFDQAEKSIKWLVYTNTWKSFLRDLDDESLGFMGIIGSLNPFNRSHGEDLNKSKTDVEMHALGVARKKSDAGKLKTHQGVLNLSRGPVPLEQVGPTCADCRKKHFGTDAEAGQPTHKTM